jgi:hypothetical protein
MTNFRVLAGLPPYRALAVPFPRSWAAAAREGLVVEFTGEDGFAWVGNFRPGIGRLMEEFVGPLLVVLGTKAIEGPLLRDQRRTRRTTGLGLERLCMRSCAPFCCGWPGRIRRCWIPRRIHQTFS